MASTLYTDAAVLGPDGAPTGNTAFCVRDGAIEWVRSSAAGASSPRTEVTLGGAFVAPGFVDAHAHLTPTGLMLGGLDLHGMADAKAMKRALAAYTRRVKDRFVWGYGWEDTRWSSPPHADAIEPAARDRFVYLSRIDGHSALASWRLLKASGAEDQAGCDIGTDGRPTGIVRRDAHHAVRLYFLSRLPAAQIRAAHRRAAAAAVAAGITTVHEMGGPLHGAGERDLDMLLEERLPVSVVCYYATDDFSVAKTRGLKQIGGDVNVDGALGSRTAALRRPYADARPHTGFLYRDAADLAEMFERATRAGLQAGVHCIGDAGCEAAVEGLEHAARKTGAQKLRRLRHRLEHFEMASRDLIRRAARVGASFSVQPAFDAAWGGGAGMYAKRVGRTRAQGMNDFRSMVASGSVVGFGSDSPVTPFDALGGVRAAMKPTFRGHALKPGEAFTAATAGAAALARQEGATGRIEPGYRADYVVWDGHPLTARRPRIRATVSRGRVVYGSLS